MSGLNVRVEVINQKGSPALYADALANRPAAGFVGRIFIDTDNPSTGIYRDTGTSWINVAAGGIVGTQNLQQVCNVGFVTTTSMGIGTSPGAFAKLQVESNDTFTSFLNSISNTVGFVKNQNLNAASVISSGPAYVAANFATNYNIVNNINIPNGVSNFGATYTQNGFTLNGNLVTQFQAAGIRAITEVKSMKAFFGAAGSGGTLTHSAGLWSYGLYSVGANPTVQNHYGVLISNQTEVFAGTVTNRYGLYQEGSQDWNYFASKVTTDVGGSPTFGAQQFRCLGNAEIQSFLQIVGAGTTSTTFGLNVLNNGGLTGLRVLDNGNCGIRVSAPTARLHIATGGATTASLGLKVRNSADTIDILSTFGTTQVIINSNSASLETSAQLQIDTTTRGFLPPRMTRAQVLAIVNPAPGLMAYATDVEHLCYYNPTSGWQKVSSANL
jgi:hypothetical protein